MSVVHLHLCGGRERAYGAVVLSRISSHKQISVDPMFASCEGTRVQGQGACPTLSLYF